MFSDTITKNIKRLYYVLKNHFDYDFKSFLHLKEERIKFQKLVYALQRKGFKFNYDYNLYINGPYSPSLANDGYIIARNLELLEKETKERFNLSASGKEKVENTMNYLQNKFDDVQWLETITTIDYLYNETYLKDKHSIYSKFMELKPHLYLEERLDEAWNIVNE